MNDWTSGYVADLDYTHDFFQELSPANMAFSAASQGQKHGLKKPGLTYCELGCGQGFSANLLAAANPHVQFHAMDFNPAMIAGAAELAAEAGLDNVTFHERAFDDFAETPGLPAAFDVIALHGVYSWVSRENRQHILDFLSRRLKPGGLVYISYNALPGWAAALPLRRILADRAAQGSGPLAPRIGEAVQFATLLQQAGAGYFTANPSATTRLAKLGDMPANYLAHEFFNKDWTPFHFADVAQDLAGAKLSFLGAASPLDRIDDIVLTAAQCEMLAAEADPVRREGLRDILVNAQFRSDLYVRGRLPHTRRGAVGAWFETPLALTKPYNGGVLKLPESQTGELLEQAQYGPVLSALCRGPATVRELLDQGVFGDMVWGRITRMLTLLSGSGHLAPCLPQVGLAERAERCRAFNLAVCKRAEESETYRFLASPVTGGGIAADWFEQLFLLARSEGRETPQDWADLAWQILAPQGQRLQHEGRVLETAEENLAVLRARAHAFAARRLPLFKSLGLTLEAERETAAARVEAVA
ncbi:class I SAM-dependent methyltransferase [Cribrihabitans pelagius]|uniref:class I SAM-dependent methyltransferase n=1 Tax=Cribrihabitans pelagius TaxID=1765746 RepID=UPI003B5B02ED